MVGVCLRAVVVCLMFTGVVEAHALGGRVTPIAAKDWSVYGIGDDLSHEPVFTINGKPVAVRRQEKHGDTPNCTPGVPDRQTHEAYGKLPLYFIRNDGQMDDRVKFYEKGIGHAVFFTEDGVYLSLAGGQEAGSPMSDDRNSKSETQNLFPNVLAGDSQSAIRSPQPAIVKLVPLGANKHPEIVAEGLQKGKVNYFIGNNPEEWRTNIPTYGAVVYKEIYKGIDITFYGNNRQLEYDIIVKPGADPSRVRFTYEGIEDLRVNKDGDLEIIVSNSANCSGSLSGLNTQNCPPLAGVKGVEEHDKNPSVPVPAFLKEGEGQPPVSPFFKGDIRDTGAASFIFDRKVGWALPTTPKGLGLVAENSKIIQKRPYVYQEIDGRRVEIKGEFRVWGSGFGVEECRLGEACPDLVERVSCSPLKRGAGGVSDRTQQHNDGFASLNPSYPKLEIRNRQSDNSSPVTRHPSPIYGFTVATYDTARTLIIDPTISYSTYIGGSSSDYGYGIAVDSSGAAYITGKTASTGFPLVGTDTPYRGGDYDAFVVKLGASGASIVYSTYIGGTSSDYSRGIAVDSSGYAYIAGETYNDSFPIVGTTTSFDVGTSTVFVTKLGTSGASIVYSTLIGGNNADIGNGIALDNAGSAYITGSTESNNFPIVGTETPYGGGQDAFVTKLGTSGASIAYSTYIGGNGVDRGAAIAVDGSGSAYITGLTQSPTTFPRVGTNTPHAGDSDVFVVKLGTVTSNLQIIYSTFIGGSGNDNGSGIAVDSAGAVYVTGFAYSSGFPVVGTTTGKNNGTGNPDAFVAKLGTDTSPLKFIYSTYIGGSTFDQGYGIAVDSSGAAYIIGETRSADFPIVGTTTGKNSGTSTSDVFLTKLSASGASITYSTYIGGGGNDYGRGIAVDSSGYAYITGETASNNFPLAGTTTAYGGGSYDVFVTKLDATPDSSGGGGGGGGGEPVKEKLTVSSVNPSSGATGVSVTTTVSATFNMYVNGSTVTTGSFKLSTENGDIEGSVVTNGATITFTPSLSLSYGTKYTATVTTKVQAANWAGTTMESDYTWKFTTESAPATPTPTATPSPTPSPTPAPTVAPTQKTTPSATSIPTPTPAPTAHGVSGELYLSKTLAYLSGDTVAVTVVDADRDVNAASEDTLTTAIKVAALGYYAGGDLALDMKENGVNSGTFLATIKTGTVTTGGANVNSRGAALRAPVFHIKTETATSASASSSVRSNIGVIKTVQGGTVTVVYTDTAPDALTITKALSFSSCDATLAFDAAFYTVGSYAVVTHVDAEENGDAAQVDTLLSHAAIETSSVNQAWMKLVETGVETGTFKGSILVSSEATLDYERIQASGGDTLTAGCPDEINTSGAPRQVTAVSRVVSLVEPTPTPVATPSPTPVMTATPTPEVCIAERITLSSYKLKIITNQRAEVTVTVTGKKDCPVEGAKVRVLYLATNPNDSGRISVSRRNAVTDADGQAVFTIKAGNKTGKADFTFKTGSLKGARLVVKIVGKKGE